MAISLGYHGYTMAIAWQHLAPIVEASVGEPPQASGAKAPRGVEARGMAADWPAAIAWQYRGHPMAIAVAEAPSVEASAAGAAAAEASAHASVPQEAGAPGAAAGVGGNR